MKKSRSGFVGCGLAAAASVVLAAAPAVAAAAPTAASTTRTIDANGITGITNASYNSLFKGGNAAAGVAALIAAGKVTINGTPVPIPTGNGTYSADKLNINDGSALWENANGTWSYEVQLLLKGSDESYANGVVDFVNAVTEMRGIAYQLTLSNGTVTAISATVKDVAYANTVTRGSKDTTFTILGAGDGSTNKPNPATLKFPNANVQNDPQAQTMMLYWKDTDGWHLQRANSRQVTLNVSLDAAGTWTERVDGRAYSDTAPFSSRYWTDSRLTLQYSEPWNRPTQPFRSMYWMGDNNLRETEWFATPGVTVGFTLQADAKSTLAQAISVADFALDTVWVSANGTGSDVPAGKLWVTQAYHDTFARAVAAARAVLDRKETTDDEYEGAFYRLAQAFGGQTGDLFSFQNNPYFGSAADNGTGFWTSAAAHVGTGAAIPTQMMP